MWIRAGVFLRIHARCSPSCPYVAITRWSLLSRVFNALGDHSEPVISCHSPTHNSRKWRPYFIGRQRCLGETEREKMPWEEIADHFPDRNGASHQVQYSRKLGCNATGYHGKWRKMPVRAEVDLPYPFSIGVRESSKNSHQGWAACAYTVLNLTPPGYATHSARAVLKFASGGLRWCLLWKGSNGISMSTPPFIPTICSTRWWIHSRWFYRLRILSFLRSMAERWLATFYPWNFLSSA